MGDADGGQQVWATKEVAKFSAEGRAASFFVVKVALQELIPRQLLALIEQFSTS